MAKCIYVGLGSSPTSEVHQSGYRRVKVPLTELKIALRGNNLVVANGNEIAFARATTGWGPISYAFLLSDKKAPISKCLMQVFPLAVSACVHCKDKVTFQPGELSITVLGSGAEE